MSKLTNIGRDDKDPSFRYKMPLLIPKIESAGNGIKTVVHNMVQVARALDRPPAYITKFFACELGSLCVIDDVNRKYVVNGKHDQEVLQKKINKFIELFVLCPKCRLPETTLDIDVKKRRITRTCICCGHVSDVDTSHKLCTYVFNNPVRSSKGTGTARSGGGAGGGAGGGGAGPASAADDSDEDFVVEPPPPDEDVVDEAQLEWSADTSAEAVAKRQAEAMRAAAVVEGPNDEDIEAAIQELKKMRVGAEPSGPEMLECVRRLAGERHLGEELPGVVFEGLMDPDPAALIKNITRYKSALAYALETRKNKMLFLGCFERMCKSSEAVKAKAAFVLKAMYDEDLMDEDTLVFWYENPTRDFVRKSVAEEIRKKAEPFITWLKTAETDDSDDEDDDDADDDDDDDDDDDAADADEGGRAAPSKPAAAAASARGAVASASAKPAAAAAPAAGKPSSGDDDSDVDIDAI